MKANNKIIRMMKTTKVKKQKSKNLISIKKQRKAPQRNKNLLIKRLQNKTWKCPDLKEKTIYFNIINFRKLFCSQDNIFIDLASYRNTYHTLPNSVPHLLN